MTQSDRWRTAPEPDAVPALTQPIVRLELDRMDDSDNCLFGVTAQISWEPKPCYQLTQNTALRDQEEPANMI